MTNTLKRTPESMLSVHASHMIRYSASVSASTWDKAGALERHSEDTHLGLGSC